MFDDRGTSWSYPSWEQEQEMRRFAEIQAQAIVRAQQEISYRAQQDAERRLRAEMRSAAIEQHVRDVVKAQPDYQQKYEQSMQHAHELKAQGGLKGMLGSFLERLYESV